MRNLIKKILKENDEFDWIRDSNPISFEYLSGKALYFNPPIDNKADLLKLLNYLSNLGFHYGNWADRRVLGLYLDPTTDRIRYTSIDMDEDYQDHINGFANRDVEVLDGWDLLKPYI